MQSLSLAAVVLASLFASPFAHASAPSKAELRKKLTAIQYEVTQEDGTEPPFKNEYWNNHEAGIYVDIVSGEPLFSSLDKFESGTGWPSFTQPLVKANIVEKSDRSLFMTRTEVRSKGANSHLGHVFDDGPAPTGRRYCMNSAALRFIPVSKLDAEGYGEFAPLFAKTTATTKATAIFAGGCFWCMESPFEKLEGVTAVVSGYTGGTKVNPTYEEVSAGATGHIESVRIEYDPAKISYDQLLNVLWRNIDPTDAGGQFVDRGGQYRSAIFVDSPAQRAAAEKSKAALAATGIFKKPIVTEILDASRFYDAEEYHQDYYKKNPIRYRYYRHGSGRDQFLDKIWKAPK